MDSSESACSSALRFASSIVSLDSGEIRSGCEMITYSEYLVKMRIASVASNRRLTKDGCSRSACDGYVMSVRCRYVCVFTLEMNEVMTIFIMLYI